MIRVNCVNSPNPSFLIVIPTTEAIHKGMCIFLTHCVAWVKHSLIYPSAKYWPRIFSVPSIVCHL